MRVSLFLSFVPGEIREVSRLLRIGASQILRGHNTYGGYFLQRAFGQIERLYWERYP